MESHNLCLLSVVRSVKPKIEIRHLKLCDKLLGIMYLISYSKWTYNLGNLRLNWNYFEKMRLQPVVISQRHEKFIPMINWKKPKEICLPKFYLPESNERDKATFYSPASKIIFDWIHLGITYNSNLKMLLIIEFFICIFIYLILRIL